ncbi:MAG: glycosyltransferase family 2 protein [Acidimicrobiaceae bacterium]|nr:glycosyltransferase family 2 protein [Acidimicrobiaceae bacterium]
MDRVSIIIPQYGRSDLTVRCIESLFASTIMAEIKNLEIVVIDDGSPDSSADEVDARIGPSIRLVRRPTNGGFSKACNAGAEVASGELLLFLNNDTVTASNWLGPMLKAMDSDPEIGIVGALLLYPDLTVQHAGFDLYGSSYLPLSPDHINRGYPANYPGVGVSREMELVTGACLLIRKDLFNQVGGFDTGYINSFEDVDLCLKARALGKRVWFEASAILFHDESVTRAVLPDRASRDFANHLRFNEAWLGSQLISLPWEPKGNGLRPRSLQGRELPRMWVVHLPNDLLLATSMISSLASSSDHEDNVVVFVDDVTTSVADYAENIQRSTKEGRFLVYTSEQISWDNLLLGISRQQRDRDVLVVNPSPDSVQR